MTDSRASSGGGAARPKRADARRNAVDLVEAAREIFQALGVDAPAKAITDRAGLGVGTLYRNFPRRSDLILAVLEHDLDACVARAVELASTLGPWEALAVWLERLAELVATKHGLAAALHSRDPAYDDLPVHLFDRLEPALSPLLARAVESNEARADVAAREIIVAVGLLCQPAPGEGQNAVIVRLRVFVDGLARTRT